MPTGFGSHSSFGPLVAVMHVVHACTTTARSQSRRSGMEGMGVARQYYNTADIILTWAPPSTASQLP